MDSLHLETTNKIKIVLSNMRKSHIYKDSKIDDIHLLNLSFRSGDDLHCQWTQSEEEYLLPILVSIGHKPVGSICNKKKKPLENIAKNIPQNCSYSIIQNRWTMWVLLIYLKDTFSKDELESLVNETNSWEKRGYMYGYV